MFRSNTAGCVCVCVHECVYTAIFQGISHLMGTQKDQITDSGVLSHSSLGRKYVVVTCGCECVCVWCAVKLCGWRLLQLHLRRRNKAPPPKNRTVEHSRTFQVFNHKPKIKDRNGRDQRRFRLPGTSRGANATRLMLAPTLAT